MYGEGHKRLYTAIRQRKKNQCLSNDETHRGNTPGKRIHEGKPILYHPKIYHQAQQWQYSGNYGGGRSHDRRDL